MLWESLLSCQAACELPQWIQLTADSTTAGCLIWHQHRFHPWCDNTETLALYGGRHIRTKSTTSCEIKRSETTQQKRAIHVTTQKRKSRNNNITTNTNSYYYYYCHYCWAPTRDSAWRSADAPSIASRKITIEWCCFLFLLIVSRAILDLRVKHKHKAHTNNTAIKTTKI